MTDILDQQQYDGNPFTNDPGSEGWKFPDVTDLDPAAAAKLWNDIEREARQANARAARLKERKATAKNLAIRAIEASPYTSVRVEVDDDREVQITPYQWEVFTLKDEEAFKAWAAEWADEGGENFYDDSPRLRESIFLDEMRRRSQDGEALPPGVLRYEDTKISRTAVPKRR